ncbi:MAG: hypothetical protein INR71_14450, partial [Terriglobus roseus]|nr:hypothetical protein [Terriglobus roseus]
MALAEAKLLKARDQTIRDEDEWPQFPVSDVEVRDPKTGDLISLLHADTKKPLVLTGKLGPLQKDQAHLLLQPVNRSTKVEVTNVTRFAYGQFDDGSYAIWALGRAGWFEIRPSRAYSETYDDTVEAIEVFYFLKDTYAWDGQDVGHRQLFKKYAEEHKETMRNAKDAAQLVYKHAAFLAKAMQKDDSAQTDGVEWTATPFCAHLRDKFPDLFGAPAAKPPSKANSVRSASASVSNGGRAARLRSVESASQKGDVADNVSTTSSRRRVFTPTGPTPEELEVKA